MVLGVPRDPDAASHPVLAWAVPFPTQIYNCPAPAPGPPIAGSNYSIVSIHFFFCCWTPVP